MTFAMRRLWNGISARPELSPMYLPELAVLHLIFVLANNPSCTEDDDIEEITVIFDRYGRLGGKTNTHQE